MIQPTNDEFFDKFMAKTNAIVLAHFGYIVAPSWKCHFSTTPIGTMKWAFAPRVYITDKYISLSSGGADRRFRAKFNYTSYNDLDELLKDLIPYLAEVLTYHDGSAKRIRDLRKYDRAQKKDIVMEF